MKLDLFAKIRSIEVTSLRNDNLYARQGRQASGAKGLKISLLAGLKALAFDALTC